MPALTRDEIADILARAYDGQPLTGLRDEHAAHHREAADAVHDTALAAMRAERAEIVDYVLHLLASSAGDDAVEKLKDENPMLTAWLGGRDAEPAQEEPLDRDALRAEMEAERAQQCTCTHTRGRHFIRNGRIVCMRCDCNDFTAQPESGPPA